ncbi:SH3 domain protein [Dictyocaulus viviparus]|uniref:SH3 domain protein n=1 Tax=Dictyocaulus viviparus TaxID=29172 RepID=A0A0D8XDG8_DICVI|nr:SH3 domain protein [Dictyocaulus viviparus]
MPYNRHAMKNAFCILVGFRELPLNRGDIVRIRREVDMNWLEGERNGQCGLFPRSYVQIDDEIDLSRTKAKAIYPFTSRRDTELELKMGELVTIRREIDENWLEGTNHLGEIGIFPRSYVQFIDDTSEGELVTIRREIDENWLEGTNHLGEIGIFPRSYVQFIDDTSEMITNLPDRPKTPKLLDRDEQYIQSNKFSTILPHETPGFSQNVNYVDQKQIRRSGACDTSVNDSYGTDKKPNSPKTEAFWCTADKIPKGSQT